MATLRPARWVVSEPLLRVAFIGAGKAGTTLAHGLRRAGYPVVAIASRTEASAERLAAIIPGAEAFGAQAAADAADLVFVTVPDDAIAAVTAGIAWRPAQAVAHVSGALDLVPLDAARDAGASVGSLHPVQTLLGTASDSLEGVTFGIEAEGWLREQLLAMADRLGGTGIDVPASARALYHAAAVMSCGYVTALLHDAAALWVRAGLDADVAVAALGRMAEATAANVRAVGLYSALTGPIARGDAATVLAHLDAIDRAAPDISESYVANGRRMAVLAGKSDKTDPSTWQALFARAQEE